MKLTKKTKKNLITGIIIVALIIGIYFFGISQPFSILQVSHLGYDISVTPSNNYYTASLGVKNLNPPSHTAGGCYTPSLTIDDTFTWRTGNDNYAESGFGIVVNLPEDVDFGRTVKVDSVSITGLNAMWYPCSDLTKGIEIEIENLTASCTPNRDSITCTVKGEVKPKDPSYSIGRCCKLYMAGNNEVRINVKLLKQGVECIDDSYCDEGFRCYGNTCIEKPINVYRLENNQCILKTILPSERLESDYDTLIECEESIIIEPPKPEPSGFWALLQRINKWIQDFFKKIFGIS